MKHTLIHRLAVAAFALAAITTSYAEDECAMPAGPIIPDGNVASEDELVAAQKAIKMYQTSLEDFRLCLDGVVSGLDANAEKGEGGEEANSDPAVEEAKLAILERYNTSVEAEQAVAEEFNEAVRAFKSRQGD